MKRIQLIAALGIVGIAGLVYAQATRSLLINGKVASTDVRVINGKAYAPIADVARALGSTVVVRGSNYEIVNAGGSNGLQTKLMGNVGDWLFDGGWRFRVLEVQRAEQHTLENPYYSETEVTAEPGKELVLVKFAARNGNKTPGAFATDESQLVANGMGEKIKHIDLPWDGVRSVSKSILPGAEVTGWLIFEIPKGREFNDLVMIAGQFMHYDDAVRPKEPSIFRVKLR